MSTSTSSSRKQRMGWASSSSGIYHHLEDNSNLSISPSSTGSMTGISLKSPTSTTTPSAASKRAGGMKRTHRLLRMFILPTLAVSVVYLQIHSLGFVVGGDWQQELDHMALWSPSTSSTTQSTSSQSTLKTTKTHQKSKHPFGHGTTPLHKLEEHRLRHVFQHSPKTTQQQAQSAISESERRLQSKTAAVTTLVPNNNNEEDPQELHELFMAQKQKRHNNNKDQTHDQVVAEFRRHAHDDNKAMLLNHFEKYQRLQHHHRDNDSSLLVQTKKHLNRQEYAVPTKQRQQDDSAEEDSPIPGTSKTVYDLVMKKRHQLELLRTRNKDQGIRNMMVKQHNEVKDESLEDDDELADEEDNNNNNSTNSTKNKKKKKKGTLLTKKHKGRQRPKEKVLFFVHIHKSGGTVLCAMAHANKLHVNTKHNCNVQTNQRCCGKSDDKEIQTAYAQQTPYDLVAAETQMYQGMDPTHYNYIVVLRSSRERYFSHWKHILRDVPPRRKPMSTTRKGIVGKAQHSSLEAAPRLHYKPKTAEMQQVIDRLSKFQQQFEPQHPNMPQETTTKLQDPLQHMHDKEAADKKGYGDEKAKPMHHLTTTDQDVKDKVAHWKQQVAVRQQERNQQHAIDNLEEKRDHEQRAAAHAREMSSHKKHHEQRLLLEEEPHLEKRIRVRDGAPGDKAVNDAKARRAKHLVALKQQGTEEEEEGGEKKKQKDDEEEDEDDGDDDEEEEKGEQQKGVDGNDKEGDNKPTPASTHTPQKRLGPKLVMPLQTRPEKPPKNLEHPAQHVPLPKKTKPVIGHTFEEWWSLQPDNWNFRQLCGTHCMGVPKYQLTLQHWQYTLDRFLQFHTVLFLEDLQDSMDVLAERLKWGQANMTAVQEAEKKERDRKARRKAEGKRARPLKTTRIPRATYPPLQPPNTTVAFASWDPLMSALDDALYDIGRRWEKLKREQKAPVQSLEVVAADGSTTTAPAHAGMLSSLTAMESLPADLLKHFERYFRDEPHNHRHQCEDECCHPICSKW